LIRIANFLRTRFAKKSGKIPDRPSGLRQRRRGPRRKTAMRSESDGAAPRCELVVLRDEATRRAAEGQAGLLLVLRGPVRIASREGRFALRRAQWYAYDAGSKAEIHVPAGARALLLETAEARLAALPAFAAVPLPNRGTLSPGHVHRLRHVLRTLRAAGMATPGDDVLDRLLGILLAETPTVAACAAACPGRTRLRRRNVLSRLQRARLYLEGHAERVVRLEELARLSHFSGWYLSRSFRRLFGRSPQAYGLEVRLQRARALVLAGPGAICDIAAACGFDNPSAFARAFHARFGISASGLRRSDPECLGRIDGIARPTPG
jgi:AraC family transcriptional regulator